MFMSKAVPTATTATAVFLGDSLIQWFEVEGARSWTRHFQPFQPVNIGVAGDTTDQTLRRLHGGSLGAVTSASLTVLLVGTNDIGMRYDEVYISSKIQEIVSTVQVKLLGTKVLLLGILPRGSLSAMPAAVNRILSTYDNGDSIRFLDMTDQFSERSGKGQVTVRPALYAHDRLHLSAEGYRVWAETMIPLFTEMIGEK